MLIVNTNARVRAAVAPMQLEARVSAPQTSQLLAGHVVQLLEQQGDWWRVQSADGYSGWMHTGYLEQASGTEHSWRTSVGAVVRESDGRVRALPVNARLADDADVLSGEAVSAADVPGRFPPLGASLTESASALFAGASYEWGGVTEWGCDCSGLAQAAFALHGRTLPRDAYQQAACGELVGVSDLNDSNARATLVDADLVFFSDREDRRVTHVGIMLAGGRMLHSALGRGGVTIEDLGSEEEYVRRLRRNFVGARRIFV